MKKHLLTSAAALFALTAISQVETAGINWYGNETTIPSSIPGELRYDVYRRSNLPVKKVNLESAASLRDFIPYYPDHWITEYVSSELSASTDGRTQKGVSANDLLTKEQKAILKTAVVGTDLAVCVNYKIKNSATSQMEDKVMKLTVTVMPETEAMYAGGYPKMSRYLCDHAITKINKSVAEILEHATVRFTVNEAGEIVQAKMTATSGDPETDQLLMDAISNMPRWKPAESKGVKVKQEFVFNVYAAGNGC